MTGDEDPGQIIIEKIITFFHGDNVPEYGLVCLSGNDESFNGRDYLSDLNCYFCPPDSIPAKTTKKFKSNYE